MLNTAEMQHFTGATSGNIADIITSILKGDKVMVDGITDPPYPYIPYTANTLDYSWPEDIKHHQSPTNICGHTELRRFYSELHEKGIPVSQFWQGIYEILAQNRDLGEYGRDELFYALTNDLSIKPCREPQEPHGVNTVLKKYVVERTYDGQTARLWPLGHSQTELANTDLLELVLFAYACHQQGETVDFWTHIIEHENTDGRILVAFRGLAEVDVAYAENYLAGEDIPSALRRQEIRDNANLIIASVKHHRQP